MIPLRVWLAAGVGWLLVVMGWWGLTAALGWQPIMEVNVTVGALAWLGPLSLAVWWDVRRMDRTRL